MTTCNARVKNNRRLNTKTSVGHGAFKLNGSSRLLPWSFSLVNSRDVCEQHDTGGHHEGLVKPPCN